MSYIEVTAIKIVQPLAEFFVANFKAKNLLEISFSEELQYLNEDGKLKGSQRKTDEKRLIEIAQYIDSVEMSFPNSIILAANYKKTGEVSDNEKERWKVEHVQDNCYKIIIPQKIPLAAIIDGQHRLKAFNHVKKQESTEIELVTSIFFDLPNSYQAFLFATINGNQKKVDKSLALEQFGFNVEEEPRKSWTPEKLAVFFTRKLNFKNDSPFHNKIKLAPKYDQELFIDLNKGKIIISTATIVDGILSLISSNPKRDRVEMGQKHILKGRSRSDLNQLRDNTPLRDLFLENHDDSIYAILVEYFTKVNELLWRSASPNSYIIKTVGIQALFDLLKNILHRNVNFNNIDYGIYIEPLRNINFSDNFFQASGTGRYRIKRVLFYANNMINDNAIKEEELADIKRLTAPDR